jgi:hypothetical protein
VPGEYVFGRGSNVLEYWLTNAEGFVVRSGGSRVGVVRRVVLDPERGRASALIVRSPLLHRRRVVLARAIETVDPAAQELELEPREPRPTKLETLARWAGVLGRHVDGARAWLLPRTRSAARSASAFARTVSAWLAPRARAAVRVFAAWGRAALDVAIRGARAPAAGGRAAPRPARPERVLDR